MRKTKNIFDDLRAEFQRRNFAIKSISSEEDAFEAHNPRLTHIPECIQVSLTEDSVYVRIVEKGSWKLDAESCKQIFRRFPTYFHESKVNKCPEIILVSNMGAARDLSEVADIAVRAYACAVDCA